MKQAIKATMVAFASDGIVVRVRELELRVDVVAGSACTVDGTLATVARVTGCELGIQCTPVRRRMLIVGHPTELELEGVERIRIPARAEYCFNHWSVCAEPMLTIRGDDLLKLGNVPAGARLLLRFPDGTTCEATADRARRRGEGATEHYELQLRDKLDVIATRVDIVDVADPVASGRRL